SVREVVANLDAEMPERQVTCRRLGVEPPPLRTELRESLLAGVERGEVADTPAAPQLGVERLSVALAPEDLRAVTPALAPAHAPTDAAVRARDALDAHADPLPRRASSSRKLPATGGRAGAGAVTPRSAAGTAQRS